MDLRDLTLVELSESQHGLVTAGQICQAGMTRDAWRHRLRSGDWERLSARVARRTGAPATAAQGAMAGVLDVGPGAYASHDSGAAAWGVPGFRVAPHHVISVRDGAPRSSPLAIVHRPRHLLSPFSTVLDGLPVVRPALLVLQLAGRVHPARLERIVDGLWSRRLLSGASLRAELEPLLVRGRAGTAAMRGLLAARPDSYVPPASNLEARTIQILGEADLPVMRRQVDLGSDERWCERVDLVAVDLPVVVEVQSERYHTALVDRRADAERRARLEAAGFVVVEVVEYDVWHRRGEVVRRVRRSFWTARGARARTGDVSGRSGTRNRPRFGSRV